MASQKEMLKIRQEINEMCESGKVWELLKNDFDVETFKFPAITKDFYIQQKQKEIISRSKFEI